MKRGGPIERRTPLRARRWGVGTSPSDTRRRRSRDRGPYADPKHLAAVRAMACCCAPFDGAACWGPIDPHHAGEGLACPDPERRKTCDRTAIPICRGHHRAIECFEGVFKLTWNETRRRQFYDVEIVKTQAAVARLLQKKI